MTNNKKLSLAVLLSFSIFGVAFPVATILSNRTASAPHIAATPAQAPKGDVEIGPVVVTETLSSDLRAIAPAPVQKAARHGSRKSAMNAEPHDCHPVELEQQGRPGARFVWACEGSI